MRAVNVPAGSFWAWEDIQLECRSRCSTMIVSVWGAAGCRNLNQIRESRPELSDCTFEVLVLGFLSNLPSAPWMEQFRTSTVLTRKQIESRIFCWMFRCAISRVSVKGRWWSWYARLLKCSIETASFGSHTTDWFGQWACLWVWNGFGQ